MAGLRRRFSYGEDYLLNMCPFHKVIVDYPLYDEIFKRTCKLVGTYIRLIRPKMLKKAVKGTIVVLKQEAKRIVDIKVDIHDIDLPNKKAIVLLLLPLSGENGQLKEVAYKIKRECKFPPEIQMFLNKNGDGGTCWQVPISLSGLNIVRSCTSPRETYCLKK